MEVSIYSINNKIVLNVKNNTKFSDFLEQVFSSFAQRAGYPRYDKDSNSLNTICMTFYNVENVTHSTHKTIHMSQTILSETLGFHNVSDATNCFIRVNISG